jgi:hypothetical protein
VAARCHKEGFMDDVQTKTKFAKSAFANSAFDYGNSTFDLNAKLP